MQIGFDAKRLFHNSTGLGNYSRSIVAGLARWYPGADYSLYTPRVRETPTTRPFLHHPHLRAAAPNGGLKALWRTYGMTKDLARDGIDLYHGLSHELPLGLRKHGIKSVVTIHDLIYRVYPETYHWADRRIYDWKFRSACERADRIVAISESTKRDVVRYFGTDPTRIEVIYQPCAPIFYEPVPADEDARWARARVRWGVGEEFVLSVGSIVERKNLLTVVEAYGRLEPAKRVPLVVVGRGRGPYRRRVAARVRELGLEKWMIWIEDLEEDADLAMLYRRALAVVYPSSYEGFGLPVAEALLCETAVITSNVSSLPEAGGPGAVYVEPGDVEGRAAAIGRVLGSSELRTRLGEVGREYARETFDPRLLTDRLWNLYVALFT